MRKILSLVLGLLWTLPVWGALPSGYTELQYIESTGTQYIDTGVKGTQNSKFDIDFEHTGTAFTPFGSRKSATVSSFAIWSTTDRTDGSLRIGFDDTPGYTGGVVKDMPARLHIVHSKSGTYVNDNLVATPTDYSNFTTPTNLMVFARTDTSLGLMTTQMKLYSLKIYDNNTLVRDLIPAQRNSNGAVGLYDTVSGEFFENAGTGEFVAGDPVTDNSCRNLFDKDAEYINAYVNANSGVLTIGNSGSTTQYSFVIPVQPNTKYTLSGMSSGSSWGSFEDNSIGATATSKLAGNGTLTTGANDKYLIGLAYASGTQYDYRQTLQIEEGDTATAYVPYCEKIKIATTKYNESAFSPLNTALANAISVVDTVVSNTITQAGRIATLQAQKQTRPNDIADDNEKCPAGKKCLLVTDTAGVPHWYEIVESILRTDYTELEYLRSDGRAYINTNYSPTSKTRIEVVAKVDPGAGNINIVGSGRGTTGDASNALLVINSLDDNIAEIKFAPTGAWIRSENVNMLEKNRLSLSATKFSVNGDVKETNDTTIPDTDNRPFYIFQRWRPSIVSTNNKVQIYEFSIYENDILVRNMIPVKRNSDGAIGMFDTVNDVFYTNAGDGEFIAGDPVAE